MVTSSPGPTGPNPAPGCTGMLASKCRGFPWFRAERCSSSCGH